MNVALLERGKVGARCREVLVNLGVSLVEPEKADLWLSVHWDKLFTREELLIPRVGVLNLHNSYLPWNRGAHATTWAIVDQTPHGATLHWVNEGIDRGDIFAQRRLELIPGETANELYQRTADLEVDLFHDCVERILSGDRTRIPQAAGGSFHRKSDFDRLVLALRTSDCEVIRR